MAYTISKGFAYISTLYTITSLCVDYNAILITVIRENRVTEIDYPLKYAIFSTACLLCTNAVHDQSANICIQGYLRILWIRNTKS